MSPSAVVIAQPATAGIRSSMSSLSTRHRGSSPRVTIVTQSRLNGGGSRKQGMTRRPGKGSLARRWGPCGDYIPSTLSVQPFISNYSELNELSSMMERMFDDFSTIDGPNRRRRNRGLGRSAFPIDVIQSENEYVLTAELPGFSGEDVSLRIDNKIMTISASKPIENEADDPDENAGVEKSDNSRILRTERLAKRSFHRSFTLPKDVDESAISAAMENGILCLTMPRMTDGATCRTIKIQSI